MQATNSATLKIIFNTEDQNIIDQLRDSISNKEYGDIRSILDEIVPQPTLIDKMVIENHLMFYTDVMWGFDGEGWYYTE